MTVHVYRTAAGRIPFTDWFRSLKDVRARALIANRIDRLQLGHLGVRRFVGDGIWEFKLPFGPGYRIYFGQEEDTIVILLIGGHKGTQKHDLEKAKTYWEDFKRSNRAAEYSV